MNIFRKLRNAAVSVLAISAFGGVAWAQSGAIEKPNLTVGVFPLTDYSAFFLGLKEGFFIEEGLNVTPRMMGGAAPVAALVGGDLDVAGITWTAFVLSLSRGIELVPISEADRGVPRVTKFVVKSDSPIKTTADLVGKKVGVITVGGLCDFVLNDHLKKQGIDYKRVGYTPISVPDMPPTLLRGGIDAACLSEPLLSTFEGQGVVRSVFDMFTGDYAGLPIIGFQATAKFANANPNTVSALKRAFAKSLKFGHENPAKLRDILPTYTTLKPEDAQRIVVSQVPAASDYGQVKRIVDMMEGLGVASNIKLPR